MGTIPGPIITFRWQTGDASNAIGQVASQLKKQLGDAGASSAKATVAAYQAAAAQLRAAIATETTGTKEIVAARQRIIALAKEEIGLHSQKASLSKLELSNLRAATLEIERQKNALAGRGALTSATQQFIDAFKLRFGGYGGGMAMRAYEPLGRFATEGVGKFEEMVGPAALAIGGITAAIAGMGVAAALTTKHMMNLAQQIQNTAAATGLTPKQVQVYGELAKEMGIDQQGIEMAFARIQSQLGEYITTGKAGGTGSQFFVKVMNQLGVPLTNKQGSLRDVNDILADFSDKLQKIPDQATRTALTMEALGTRGRVLAQVMQEAASEGKSLGQVLREIGASGIVISDAQLSNLMQAKGRWDELKRSIEAAKIQIEGMIALSVTHPLIAGKAFLMGSIPGAGPKAAEDYINKALGPAQSTGTGGGLSAAVLSATSANEGLAQRLEVLKAGGEIQLQLLQAEASYSSAVKSHNQALIGLYASQISMLRQIIALEEKRGKMTPFNKLVQRTGFSGRPLPRFSGGAYSRPGAVPEIPGFASPNLPEGNPYALLGIPDPELTAQGIQAMQKLHDEWINSTSDAVTKIHLQYQRELENFNTLLIEKKISAQQFAQAQFMIAQMEGKAEDDLRKTQLEKYKNEAGQLFDAMIGGSKDFGQMFVRILEGAVLAPVKEVFSEVIGKMLKELDDILTGKGKSGQKIGKKGAPAGAGTGGVLGKIIADIEGALGIGQNAPTALAVSQMSVQAQSVIIYSAGGIGGATGGGIGNNLFGGGMNFGGGTMGSIGSFLGSVIPGAVLLGAGLHDSNPAAIAMGIGMTGGAALTSISGMLSKSHPELAGMLGKIGGALPGIGMIAAGTQMGGVGGFFTGMGGGALAGMELGGPIGAAIGAVVGGITSLFGGGSAARHAANWQKAVTRAMRGEQLILPPSETFAFSAMGSMAQTLGTTFSEGPGGRFGNVALPANTPFWANAILGYPKTGGQLTALQNALAGVNTGLPFFGGNQTPFTGLPLPPGTSSYNMNSETIIHIQVDGKTIASALVKHMPNRAAHANSGMRQAAFAATEMP